MSISQGVAKQTRFKRQGAKGTLAGDTAGQILRRVKSIFELQKETYNTADEITSTQQLVSNRHGVRQVNGSIEGILTPGTYSDIMSAILRRDFAAVADLTGISLTITGTGPVYTLARAAGSYLTGGLKVGMVVRAAAAGLNAANASKNVLILSVTALEITVLVLNGSALVAEGPIATTTISVPGKVTYVPTSGHTKVYYTVEEWYPDVPSSERNQDVVIGAFNLALPGTGNATVNITALGLDQSKDTTAYFTAPASETTTEALVAASGALLVNGVAQAIVTDLQINIDANQAAADGVVGTNIRPDVFVGKVLVSGQFTAYFDSADIPDLFNNETAFGLVSALLAGSEANADFMTFSLSKMKLNSNTPDDAETGLKRVYQYQAQLNTAGHATTAQHHLTTLQVQDSAA